MTCIPLTPLSLPLLVPAKGMASLLLGIKRARAVGRVTFVPGTYALESAGIAGLVIPDETTCDVDLALTLGTERVAGGQLAITPVVEHMRAELSADLRATLASGVVGVVRAFEVASKRSEALESKLDLQLADTIGLSLAQLVTRAAPSGREVNSVTDIVSLIELSELTVELGSGGAFDASHQRFVVEGGWLRFTDVSVSRELVSARGAVDLRFGPGSTMGSERIRLEVDEGRLRLEALVEREEDTLFVAALTPKEGTANGLDIAAGRLCFSDRAAVGVSQSQVALSHLIVGKLGLGLGLRGALSLQDGRVAFGPAQLHFDRGHIGALSITAYEEHDKRAYVTADDVTLEEARLALVENEDGKVEIAARSLTLPHGRSGGGAMELTSAATTLTYEHESGRSIQARSDSPMTIALETPRGLSLGVQEDLAGTKLSARWERLELDLGKERLSMAPAGLALEVLRDHPLEIAAEVHSESTHIGDLPTGLSAFSLKLNARQESRTGAASSTLAVPFAFIAAAIRRDLPPVLKHTALDGDLGTRMLERLGAKGRGFRRLPRARVSFEVDGHHDLALSAAGRRLRLTGEVHVVAVLGASLGSRSLELARKAFTLPIDATVDVSTNAPSAAQGLTLILRPHFRVPDDPDSYVDDIAQLLVDEVTRKPFEVAIGSLIAPQLATLGSHLAVELAEVDVDEDGLRLRLDVAAL